MLFFLCVPIHKVGLIQTVIQQLNFSWLYYEMQLRLCSVKGILSFHVAFEVLCMTLALLFLGYSLQADNCAINEQVCMGQCNLHSSWSGKIVSLGLIPCLER